MYTAVTMAASRTRYTPRLDDSLIHRLYREARRQGRPMTLVLDQIVRAALPDEQPALVAEPPPPPYNGRRHQAA